MQIWMAKKARRRGKPLRRYSWALRLTRGDPRLAFLSSDGKEGLGYAKLLAENALDRRLAALAKQILPDPLTVAELAERKYTSPIRINKQIKQARIELFGRDLTDSAIYYRLRYPPPGEPRCCAEPGCSNLIRRHAPQGTRYCLQHSRVAARVRRHRRRPNNP
ncbi:MAG: hypothetical protein QOH23_1076 [Gaiellaceae bacterium]|nr:hypothetical protein [Gaiellaceae bacterium]